MKPIKIAAIILSAVMLLCSCGASEPVNTEESTAATTAAATLSESAETVGEITYETAETYANLIVKKTEQILNEAKENESGFYSDIDTQDANATAELVFQYAATFSTKVIVSGGKLDEILYSGSLGEKFDKLPDVKSEQVISGDDITNALRYYMGGENGGVYVVLFDEYYNPVGALWAADEETSIVGAFPVARTAGQNESGDINTADIYKAAGLD